MKLRRPSLRSFHDHHWRAHPAVPTGDELTFGERAADVMRNAMGSWPFVFGFFGVMAAWMVVNTIVLQRLVARRPFDPYPYILLNLCLSCLAAVQAAALLIAAKRADAIASAIALHTEANTTAMVDLLAENTEITRTVHGHTAQIEEVHAHVTALTRHFELPVGSYDPDDLVDEGAGAPRLPGGAGVPVADARAGGGQGEGAGVEAGADDGAEGEGHHPGERPAGPPG